MAAARRRLVRRRALREAGRAACLQAELPAQRAAMPLVLRAVDPAACRAVARRGVPGADSGSLEPRFLAPRFLAPAAPECPRRAESCPAVAAEVRRLVSARLTMAAFPAYAAAALLLHHLRPLAGDRHEAARRAPVAGPAVVQNAGDPLAEAEEPVPRAARPQVGLAVSAHYAAAPRPEGRAAACGAAPQAAERVAAARGAGRLRVAEEVVVAPDAGEARQPEAAAEGPGAAEGPQLEAAAVAEPDGVARPQVVAAAAAARAAVALRPAAVPSVLPSASVCRPGRLRPRAQVQPQVQHQVLPQVPAPRPAARCAHGRWSSQSAAPSGRWSQAAQHEVSS